MCIVGGGISGLSAALHLAERGFSVALLEAKHLGIRRLGPQRRPDDLRLRREPGETRESRRRGRRAPHVGLSHRRHGAAARAHRAALASTATTSPGHMHVGVKRAPRRRTARRSRERCASEYDYRSVRFVGPRRAAHADRRASDTPARCYDSNGGHLHPYNYTLGLARRGRARRRRASSRTRR